MHPRVHRKLRRWAGRCHAGRLLLAERVAGHGSPDGPAWLKEVPHACGRGVLQGMWLPVLERLWAAVQLVEPWLLRLEEEGR